MKRIQTLRHPTIGLSGYLVQPDAGSSWDDFRNHDRGEPYRELRNALENLQHGLCGYCEIALKSNDRKIEHVIPRDLEPGQTFNHENMIACCTGGTAVNLFGPDVLMNNQDSERALLPIAESKSCDQAKENRLGALDPRDLPAVPSLLRVRSSGEIDADDSACESTGIPADDIRDTIKILGLNVRRLRQAREKHRRALADAVSKNLNTLGGISPAATLEAMAREKLLPNADNAIPKFFTTVRSYFGPLAESILAEPPQSWI